MRQTIPLSVVGILGSLTFVWKPNEEKEDFDFEP